MIITELTKILFFTRQWASKSNLDEKIKFLELFCSRHLFIGNLCNITIESLREYCEKYGPITDLSLNRDKEKNVNISFFGYP